MLMPLTDGPQLASCIFQGLKATLFLSSILSHRIVALCCISSPQVRAFFAGLQTNELIEGALDLTLFGLDLKDAALELLL